MTGMNLARVYDWLLGGDQHLEADREFGRRLEAVVPEARDYARENRGFLVRAVRYALDQGVRQFVEIGSGLPTQGHVHQVAGAHPAGRPATVIYVDSDPDTRALAERLLAEQGESGRHRAVAADLLDSPALWTEVLRPGLIDPAQPVCLSVVALLHFVKDEQRPAEHLSYYRDRLPAGSLLVLSHTTADGAPDPPIRRQAEQVHRRADPGQLRGRAEFAAFFGDFELVDPGLVYAPQWRPSPDVPSPFAAEPARSHTLAAVGRKL